MNVDDSNFFEWAFKISVGAILAIMGWLGKSWGDDLKALERSQEDFRFEAEKTYAKDMRVEQALQKRDERIDNVLARIDYRMDEMANDIKTLIRQSPRGV